MADFKMSGENMNQLIADLKMVQQDLNDSYTALTSLKERISNDGEWEGRAKDAFGAYIELMDLYHKSFTDNEDNENPIAMAIEALLEAEENVNNFYIDFPEYSKLEEIE